MISGSRNEPPISISSPRDTIVSLPSASAFSASTSAPALLLTASAASAPVSRSSQPEIWSSRSPRRPVSTSYSRVEGSRIAAAAAAIAASGNGARPRLVCSTVPVRLNTRRCDGRHQPGECTGAVGDDVDHPGPAGRGPARRQCRPDGVEHKRAPVSRDQGAARLGSKNLVDRGQRGAASALCCGHQAMAGSRMASAARASRRTRG